MIYAEKLSRLYGAQYAVHDLSFHVRQGEVMGLLGPNGAGKSTTMKMLTCYLPPSSGSASIHGKALQADLAVRRSVGYLPEHAPLYTDLDVLSHLRFMGQMQAIPSGTLQDKITEMSAACHLETVLHRRIDELSKGYRQRVGLAASMLHDPACLILDEPTTGLDPNQIVEIRHLIRHLGEKKTVLLSSHVLSEVEAVCDRMMIIDGGELQVLGTREELTRQAQGGQTLHVRLRGDMQAVIERVQKAACECCIESTEGSDMAIFSHVDEQIDLAAIIFHAVVDAEAVLLEMRVQQTSLEDVFHRITRSESCE